MDSNLSPVKSNDASNEDCEISEKRQSELVKFFSKTTRLDYTNSRHWLETANWKIDVALKSFEAQRYGTSDENAFRPPRPPAGQVDNSSSSDVSSSGPEASVKPQSDASTMASTKPADKPLFSGKGNRLGGPEEMRNIPPPPVGTDVRTESSSNAGQVDNSSNSDVSSSGPEASVKPQSDASTMASTKPADKPLFSGKGNRLGGPEEMRNIPPPPVGTDVRTESSSNATGNAVKLSAEEEALFLAGYDSSRPHTTLQIRFPDCSRVVVHGNCSHTVGDVRRFIAQKKPELKAKTVTLSTSFPRKELTDDTQSLQSADVLNAVLVAVVR